MFDEMKRSKRNVLHGLFAAVGLVVVVVAFAVLWALMT